MKLLIVSDLHLEWGSFELPNDIDFDVLIFAGDITNDGLKSVRWASRASVNKGRPTLFVPGNHEFYREHMKAVNDGMARVAHTRSNGLLHVLNPSEVIIDGVRFLGCTLWTDFDLPISGQSDSAQAMAEASESMNDFQMIKFKTDCIRGRRAFQPADARERHREDRDWLLERLKVPFAGRTVVITHHAPSLQSVAEEHRHERLSACYASVLPPDFFEVPVLWVHGHMHASLDYQEGSCRVVCNPRGYRNSLYGYTFKDNENFNFNPALIVEI